MANVAPIITGTAVDFTGEEYEIEELPPVDGLADGTYCDICYPGGSGWYQDEYVVRCGAWERTASTAPWQLSVG
jgi:hypothetical protein